MALKTFILLATAVAARVCATPVPPAELPIEVVSGTSNMPDELELTAARAMIFDVQRRLGQRAYAELVWDDIAASDRYWKTLQAELNKTSPEEQPTPLLSLAQVKAYAPQHVLNSSTIFNWTIQAGYGYPSQLMHTNPQHRATYGYGGVKDADIDYTGFEGADGIQLETWGAGPQNVTVYFGVYGLDISEKLSFMPALDDYDLQYLAEMRIRDGSLVGWTLKAAKDYRDAVEVWQGTYILGNAAQWISDALTAHLTHEFTETLRLSYAYGLGQVDEA